MTTPILYIGNKNYSSWSLRAWLALTWAGVTIEERLIPLGSDGYRTAQMPEVLAVSPSGRVPVLHVDGTSIWDSLAIGEWAAEKNPKALLPTDAEARAVCRSVIAEMHSGFTDLRRDLSMDLRKREPTRAWPEGTRRDIARILDLWQTIRATHGAAGPFLFGARTLADAFFAPVCTRFRTYGVTLDPGATAYSEAVFADEAFLRWERDAKAEPWTIA